MIARRRDEFPKPKHGKYHDIVVRMLSEGIVDYPPEEEPPPAPVEKEPETDEEQTLFLFHKRLKEGKIDAPTFVSFLVHNFGTSAVEKLSHNQHVKTRNHLRRIGKA